TTTWVSGNAGSSNSHYLESHSIPYRTVMDQLPTDGTVIELVLGYDAKRSGAHAIDYLTQFQRLLPHVLFAHHGPEIANPRDRVPLGLGLQSGWQPAVGGWHQRVLVPHAADQLESREPRQSGPIAVGRCRVPHAAVRDLQPRAVLRQLRQHAHRACRHGNVPL